MRDNELKKLRKSACSHARQQCASSDVRDLMLGSTGASVMILDISQTLAVMAKYMPTSARLSLIYPLGSKQAQQVPQLLQPCRNLHQTRLVYHVRDTSTRLRRVD
jgi:hypothetical protein